MYRVRAEGLVLAIACVGVLITVWMEPDLIRFWPFSAAEFVQTFTPLVLVALFIERALEVLLTPWRGGDSAQIARRMDEAKKLVDQGRREYLPDLYRSRVDITEYKAKTQRYAFLGALSLGIVVSALGVRGLALFVDPAAFKELSVAQRNWFNATDVLLTGALLGGGADGLHKLVSVFTTFMDTTAKKARGDA